MAEFIVGEPFWMAGGVRRSKRDYLPILDAAYDLCADDSAWLQGVLSATYAAIGRGHGAYAFFYDIPDDLSKLHVHNPVFLDCPNGFFSALMAVAPDIGPEQIHAGYFGRPCRAVSDVHQASGATEPTLAEHKLAAATGIRDQFIVNAWGTPGHGTGITVLSGKRMPFPPASARMMTKVSRHIAAARRLRSFVRRAEGKVSIDADAVLTPEGKVLHAEPNSAGEAERFQLSGAVRVLVENRDRLAAQRPSEVVGLWNALVNGQWSLVSSVDTDGKRFVLARRNAPNFRDPAALTPEERHLAVLFAHGHAGKLVAYELGLAPSTVSQSLKRVLQKLKLHSLAELVRLLGGKPA